MRVCQGHTDGREIGKLLDKNLKTLIKRCSLLTIMLPDTGTKEFLCCLDATLKSIKRYYTVRLFYSKPFLSADKNYMLHYNRPSSIR